MMSTNAKILNAHNLQFMAVFTIFTVRDNHTFQIISVWFILHLKLLLLLLDSLTVTVRHLCFNCVLLWFCLILFIFVQCSWVITDQWSSIRTHSSGPEDQVSWNYLTWRSWKTLLGLLSDDLKLLLIQKSKTFLFDMIIFTR